jgi:hypothetical protein
MESESGPPSARNQGLNKVVILHKIKKNLPPLRNIFGSTLGNCLRENREIGGGGRGEEGMTPFGPLLNALPDSVLFG